MIKPARILAAAGALATATAAAAEERPETIRGCTLIEDRDARLACFDAAFAPPSAGAAPFTPAIVGPLLVELGDPGFMPPEVDYGVAQNGAMVRALMVGTWAAASWPEVLDAYRNGAIADACDPFKALTIWQADDDAFTLTAEQAFGDQPVRRFDLVWRGGNGFAWVNNLSVAVAAMGMPLDAGLMRQLGPQIGSNVTTWTITPRSADVLVAHSPDQAAPLVFYRCPA
ncbi:MAG: hypothetical protein R3F55_15555 [Alphaproteobacteria bacterium]